LDQLVQEARHAAHDLARASARLSMSVLAHAKVAARDPSTSAKKAADRLAKELEKAGKDIERLLQDLK
jgi:hypothetical protein